MVVDITSWATTPANDARMNRCTNIANTGTYLSTIDKTKHGIVICTSTGGGLEKDHVYVCDAAGEAFIDMTSIAPHAHIGDPTGGGIESMHRFNPGFCDLWLTKTQDLDKANWIQSVSGTGSIEAGPSSDERSIRLRPNGTSGSAATIVYPHLKLDFSKRSFMIAKLQIETASSLALHAGVHADTITSADSNNRKYQAEVCTATNNNWWLRTASGSSNSASDTGIAINTSRVSVCIRHDPDDGSTFLIIDENTQLEKTSNIPTDSSSASGNLVKFSIKNSTAADRPLLMYGTRVGYYITDDWKQ